MSHGTDRENVRQIIGDNGIIWLGGELNVVVRSKFQHLVEKWNQQQCARLPFRDLLYKLKQLEEGFEEDMWSLGKPSFHSHDIRHHITPWQERVVFDELRCFGDSVYSHEEYLH